MLSQKQLDANRRNLRKAGQLTEEGRARLREAARRNRPWEHTTGPRTAEGLARSSKNALKHGRDTNEAREFRERALRFLRLNRRFVEGLLLCQSEDEREATMRLLREEADWIAIQLERQLGETSGSE